MEEFEKELLKTWSDKHEFNKIVHYVNLLKDPSYEHLCRKASALNNMRKYYEAIDVLENVREQGENDATWYYRYGYALMYVNEFTKAEKYLLKSTFLEAKNNDSWRLLKDMYQYIFLDAEKERWASEHIPKDSIVDILFYDDFVSGQTFDKRYNLLENVLITDLLVKNEWQQHFEKVINALEHIVQTNSQIPKLSMSLAQSICEQTEYITHHVIDALVGDYLYILDWFGVDEKVLRMSIDVFIYVFEYATHIVQDILPEDFLQLYEWIDTNNIEAIDNYVAQLPTVSSMVDAYCTIAKFYTDLDLYEKAIDCLNQVDNSNDQTSEWHCLYGFSLANLNKFEEARDYLYKAVTLDKTNEEAWIHLETLFLLGLNDVNGSKWAREQRKKNCRYDQDE